MPDEMAISVENVTKIYKLYDTPQDRVKESLHPLRKKYHKDFYALSNVSLDIQKGETVGIIGSNGSGKSTLLKTITGVLTPTQGSVRVNGRFSALLELGAGFNPQLTGMENVFFNGTIQGFTRDEMNAKLDLILSFADIGQFINQPVKTYSSGMFVRLAFAVAISADPDILIIDEALAVGDTVFQQKCYKKFNSLQNEGKTIVFVSHSLENIVRYCNKAIVLNKGIKITEGPSKHCVDVYKKIITGHSVNGATAESTQLENKQYRLYRDVVPPNPNATVYGNGTAEIFDYGLLDNSGEPTSKLFYNDSCKIVMRIRFNDDIKEPIFAYTIRDIKGLEITGTNTLIAEVPTGDFKNGDCVTVSFAQKMNLRPGKYSLCLGCTRYCGEDLTVYHRRYDILLFEIFSSKHKFATGFYDLGSDVELTRNI